MSEEFERFLARLTEDLQYTQIGVQNFTSSELYICDPMDQAKAPISTPITPGAYPLYVVRKDWTYHSEVEPSPHNARFEVWFYDTEPAEWKQLIPEGDYAFSAEFGSMAFLDKRLMDCLTPINEKGELFDEYLSHQLYGEDNKPRNDTEVKIDENYQFFVVYSGAGNGMYPAFAGHDESGKLLRISVDFEL